MAMPALETRRWSADDVRALPDEPGKQFECVDGELLVSPGPRLPHQSMVAALWRALDLYVHAEPVGAVFTAPGELELDAFTLVQPDLFVLPLVDGRRPRTVEEIGMPLLFVEVLSPSTARYDKGVKRKRYQRSGVEYWIVDLDARLVERWLPGAKGPEIIVGAITWQPAGAENLLTLDLIPLFVEALGEPQDTLPSQNTA